MATPCLGDWVDFQSLDWEQSMTGFVVRISGKKELAKVYVPQENKIYLVRFKDLSLASSGLRDGDTAALIDLSLQTRDEKWFQELVAWKPQSPADKHKTFLWIFVPLLALFLLLI